MKHSVSFCRIKLLLFSYIAIAIASVGNYVSAVIDIESVASNTLCMGTQIINVFTISKYW